MKEKLLTFTEGSSAALAGAAHMTEPPGVGEGGFHFSSLSFPFLASTSYYSASKKTNSNRRAKIFKCFTQK